MCDTCVLAGQNIAPVKLTQRAILKPGIRNPDPETGNQKPETGNQNPESEIDNEQGRKCHREQALRRWQPPVP